MTRLIQLNDSSNTTLLSKILGGAIKACSTTIHINCRISTCFGRSFLGRVCLPTKFNIRRYSFGCNPIWIEFFILRNNEVSHFPNLLAYKACQFTPFWKWILNVCNNIKDSCVDFYLLAEKMIIDFCQQWI